MGKNELFQPQDMTPVSVGRKVMSFEQLKGPLGFLMSLKKHFNTPDIEEAKSYRSQIFSLLRFFPQLATERDAVLFPDGHLEIAPDIFEGHYALWQRRKEFCQQHNLAEPKSMISALTIEVGGINYLRVDSTIFEPIKAKVDPLPLTEKGYLVLDPEFHHLLLPEK